MSRSTSAVRTLAKSVVHQRRGLSLTAIRSALPISRGPSRKAAGAVQPEIEQPIRLLHPHVLAGRLTRLADENKLDEAIYKLQNAPGDASNVATWNTLIWLCLRAERFKAAYKLYVDVCHNSSFPSSTHLPSHLDEAQRSPSQHPDIRHNARRLVPN